MIRTRFIVTVEVEANSEAESWRLFNEKLSTGEDCTVQTQELHRDPCHVPRVGATHSTMYPVETHDTTPACRTGSTMPCSGVQPRYQKK